MPRFFFDLEDHENSPDEIGTELPDDAHARVHGAMFAGEYLRDHPELIWDGKEIRVIVRDEERRVVFTVIVLAVDSN